MTAVRAAERTTISRALQAPSSVTSTSASTAFVESDRRDSNQNDQPQSKRRKTVHERHDKEIAQSHAATQLEREGTPFHFTPDHPQHGVSTYKPAPRKRDPTSQEPDVLAPNVLPWEMRQQGAEAAREHEQSAIGRSVQAAADESNTGEWMKTTF
jgi:hypothetical protein